MTVENALHFEDTETVRVMAEEFETHTSNDALFISHAVDITTEDVMRAIEASGTLDFWNDPAEDTYSEQDGDPV